MTIFQIHFTSPHLSLQTYRSEFDGLSCGPLWLTDLQEWLASPFLYFESNISPQRSELLRSL